MDAAKSLFGKSRLKILEELFRQEKPINFNELQRRTGCGSSSMVREIDLLEKTGVISTFRIVNSKMVSLRKCELTTALGVILGVRAFHQTTNEVIDETATEYTKVPCPPVGYTWVLVSQEALKPSGKRELLGHKELESQANLGSSE